MGLVSGQEGEEVGEEMEDGLLVLLLQHVFLVCSFRCLRTNLGDLLLRDVVVVPECVE